MANVTLPVQLAPEYLDQPILPGWQFSLFSVDLGHSSDPETERAVIDEIGSYGKQLGHLAEALEVVINELGLMDRAMTQHKLDALQVFLGVVAAARSLKQRSNSKPLPARRSA
jgi:hypothetical protein